MQLLKKLAIGLGVLYLGICLLLYFGQEQLIFHPRKIEASRPIDWGKELWVQTADGEQLHSVWVDGPSDEVVLYLHGNVGDVNRGRYQVRKLIESSSFDVVVMDYRSFGKSTGRLQNDKQLIADVEAVYNELLQHYSEAQISVLGYSLGTGMAAQLAARHQPARLVLVAPYTSLTDMKNIAFWWVPDFLLKYQLDTEAILPQVHCPITIYHGIDDELIPVEMGQRLSGLSPKQTVFHALPGASHRGAILSLSPEWVEYAEHHLN